MEYLKRLVVEQNGRKFGTWGTTVHKNRVLLMPNSLSLVWGHSVHFCKISDSTIFETLLLPVLARYDPFGVDVPLNF